MQEGSYSSAPYELSEVGQSWCEEDQEGTQSLLPGGPQEGVQGGTGGDTEAAAQEGLRDDQDVMTQLY